MRSNRNLTTFFVCIILKALIFGCSKDVATEDQSIPNRHQTHESKPPNQQSETKSSPADSNKNKPQQDGGQNVGGGDPIKSLFFQARQKAVQLIDEVQSDNKELSQFLTAEEKTRLKEDILQSPHLWDNPQAADCKLVESAVHMSVHRHFCGYTGFESKKSICFKTPECSERIGDNIYAAAALLIHESLHHRGLKEESVVEGYETGIVPHASINPKIQFLARMEGRLIPVKNRIIFIGGYEKTPSRSLSRSASSVVFDFVKKSWSRMSSQNEQGGIFDFSTVSNDDEVYVFGGIHKTSENFPFGTVKSVNLGGKYNALTNTWKPMKKEGAPSERFGHSAVWTGNKMIVWGGRHELGKVIFFPAADNTKNSVFLNDGGIYDPAKDGWTEISKVDDAPTPRFLHVSAWLGSKDSGKMIIWGGFNSKSKLGPWSVGDASMFAQDDYLSFVNDGKMFDLSQNKWQPLPELKNPPNRRLFNRISHAFAVEDDDLYVVGSGERISRFCGHDFKWHDGIIPKLSDVSATGEALLGFQELLESFEKVPPSWEICSSDGKLYLFSTSHNFAGWIHEPYPNTWIPIPDFGKVVADHEYKLKRKGYLATETSHRPIVCMKDKAILTAYHSPIISIQPDIFMDKMILSFNFKENKWELIEGLDK